MISMDSPQFPLFNQTNKDNAPLCGMTNRRILLETLKRFKTNDRCKGDASCHLRDVMILRPSFTMRMGLRSRTKSMSIKACCSFYINHIWSPSW